MNKFFVSFLFLFFLLLFTFLCDTKQLKKLHKKKEKKFLDTDQNFETKRHKNMYEEMENARQGRKRKRKEKKRWNRNITKKKLSAHLKNTELLLFTKMFPMGEFHGWTKLSHEYSWVIYVRQKVPTKRYVNTHFLQNARKQMISSVGMFRSATVQTPHDQIKTTKLRKTDFFLFSFRSSLRILNRETSEQQNKRIKNKKQKTECQRKKKKKKRLSKVTLKMI